MWRYNQWSVKHGGQVTV